MKIICWKKINSLTKLKLKVDQVSSKRKKETVAKNSSFHPAKEKKSLQSVADSSQPEPKLSAIFLELRNDLFKQQQVKETEMPYVEDHQLEEEATPTETIDQENPTVHGIYSELLSKLAFPSE